MNTEQVLEDREYMDLYNKGYGIYQFSPELAEMFEFAYGNNPKLEPYKAGLSQAKEEAQQAKSYVPDWLRKDRFQENAKDIGNSLDRDFEQERDQ